MSYLFRTYLNKTMDKKTFIKLMSGLKTLEQNLKGVDKALQKLSPDFGGFFIASVNELVLDAIKSNFNNDPSDWIGYYIYDLDWGKDWKKGAVTSKDGKDIKLKTLSDLYNILTETKVIAKRFGSVRKSPYLYI